MSLTFNAKSHRYKLDGKPTTGVTTIIGETEPKTALMDWYARSVAEYVHGLEPYELEELRSLEPVMYHGKTERPGMVEHLRKIPYQLRDAAAERGTAIHDLGQRLLETGEVKEVPAIYETPFQGLYDFIETWELTPWITEKSLGNRTHGYVGRVDFIGTSPYLNGGAPVLIDWKTTNHVYDHTALQAAAYARMEFWVTDDDPNTEYKLPEISATYVAHINHSYTELHPLAQSPAEIDKHFEIFLDCLKLFKSRKGIKGALKPALDAPTKEKK